MASKRKPTAPLPPGYCKVLAIMLKDDDVPTGILTQDLVRTLNRNKTWNVTPSWPPGKIAVCLLGLMQKRGLIERAYLGQRIKRLHWKPTMLGTLLYINEITPQRPYES